MVKKPGLPQKGELVVCEVTHVSPHSVIAKLLEYDAEGMIHVSQVASGWIKDIRKHAKVGQVKVAKVMRVEESINLSFKQVSSSQQAQRTREYQQELRAEKMLEIISKEVKSKSSLKEITEKLMDEFGSMYEALKLSTENKDVLTGHGIPKEWAEKIIEIAKKNIERKEYVFRKNLEIQSFKPDGISVIKNFVKKIEKNNLEIKYISAPTYSLTYKTKSKSAKKEFAKILEKIEKVSKDLDIEVGINA